jgi:hypothetical protein
MVHEVFLGLSMISMLLSCSTVRVLPLRILRTADLSF